MLTLFCLTNEQEREKLMTSFHSELTALSSAVNISFFLQITQNWIKHQVLVFDQDFAISQHAQNTTSADS